MKLEVLEKDNFYHIYNRGINGASIFESDENMRYFLTLVEKHLSQNILILSYCLLKNHYHFLVRINCDGKVATQLFSNLFNAYAKAYNKQQNRTGSLFEKHFKRKKIFSNKYLRNLIIYIHRNPENHHIIDDFRKYNFSSYQEITSGNTDHLNGTSPEAKRLGDIACSYAGVVGTGNGRGSSSCQTLEWGKKKKEWYQEYEKELIVTGIGVATLFAVLNRKPIFQIHANDNGYELGLQSAGYNLRYSEDNIQATYRIEF